MGATPILDRNQPAPMGEKRQWLAVALGAAIGGCILPLIPAFDADSVLERPLEFGLTLWGAYYAAVLLHELGHLLAGVAAGFAFRQFAAGPLVLNLENGGLRVRFAGARLLSGGQVAMAPESTERLRARFLQFIAGGPAVTLLLFAVPLAVRGGMPGNCVLVVNLWITLSSLLPYTINGRSTDAKLLLGLLRPGPAADRLATILYLLAIDGRGTAPRDWPADSLHVLEGGGGDAAYCEIGRMFAYFRAMDGGEPERMAEALERVLAVAHRLNPDSRRAYFAEAAFVQGIFRRDATLARVWLDDARRVKGTLPKEDWDSAALAGIACAEGDAARAAAQLSRAIAMLDRQPGASGSVAACRGRLAALLQGQGTAC